MELILSDKMNKFMSASFDIKDPLQLALIQIASIVRNQAKLNSPFLTWNLRESITADLSEVKQLIAIVWAGDAIIKYAKIREFINYKNPSTRFYLKRGYTMQKERIGKIVRQALKIYI